MAASVLNDADRRQLAERGIAVEEAERQLALLRGAARGVELVRPCTLGDGIERIESGAFPELIASHDAAARDGRMIKLVPASGVASRMFRELLHFQRGPGRRRSWNDVCSGAERGEAACAALTRFLEGIRRFPFHERLRDEIARRGEELDGLARIGAFRPVLDALLDAEGLGYDGLPKALLPFHRYPHGSRTPFEEHLVEAAQLVRDGRGVCRLHFTVSPEHHAAFERLFEATGGAHAARHGVSFEVGYSVQKPSTDTLASDLEGRPLRDPDGALAFRPGGHGALIENLGELTGDIVFLRNIDNVQPDAAKPPTLEWKRVLSGYLVRLQAKIHEYVDRLSAASPSPELLDEVLLFTQTHLHSDVTHATELPSFQSRRAALILRLNRPLRVCGVVPNTGEPGGGPFWVRGRDGAVSLQIVEAAEVRAEQRPMLASSTHFNPVDMVCAVRDAEGAPYDLERYIDPDAVILTRKSSGGRELIALERPGLWNGAMARWNTVFVEVPISTFTPVKSVLDLLREEHRTPGE